ncbi:hypothetical protein PLACP1_01280 [Planifilum fimeticola]
MKPAAVRKPGTDAPVASRMRMGQIEPPKGIGPGGWVAADRSWNFSTGVWRNCGGSTVRDNG